jgi:hypothetical protein
MPFITSSPLSHAKGYRKIPGDTCVGGIPQFDEVLTKECPVPNKLQPTGLYEFFVGLIVVLVVLLVLAVMLIVGFCIGMEALFHCYNRVFFVSVFFLSFSYF